jgi:hypothetical protein
MKARTIQLRVLGTYDYYQKQKGRPKGPSVQLQDAISQSLNQFASASLGRFSMDFQFDVFRQDFSWSVADQKNNRKILAALKGIRPLFGR